MRMLLFLFIYCYCHHIWVDEFGDKLRDISQEHLTHRLIDRISAVFHEFIDRSKITDEYGGELGNAIFKTYEKIFVSPVVRDYFTFLQTKKNITHNALDVLLTHLGYYRRKIALLATDQKNEFGLRKKKGSKEILRDDVGYSVKWEPWRKAVLARVMVIKAYGIRSTKKCPDHDNGLEYRSSNHIVTICPAVISYQGVDDSGDYEIVLKDMNVDDIDKLSADDIDKKLTKTRDEIENILKKDNKTDEEKKYIKHPGIGLYFYHLNAIFMDMPWASDTFFASIKPSIELDKLKNMLCMILWKFSHSTTYMRGQAAITLWLLKGIAGLHNYELSFSETWQPPKYPNYDQQALLYLDIDEFLPVCRENMLLQAKKYY